MKNPNLNKIIADNLDKAKFQSKSVPSLPTNSWLDQYKRGGGMFPEYHSWAPPRHAMGGEPVPKDSRSKNFYSILENAVNNSTDPIDQILYQGFKKFNEAHGYAPVNLNKRNIVGKRAMTNPLTGSLNIIKSDEPAYMIQQYMEEYPHYQQYNKYPDQSGFRKAARSIGNVIGDYGVMFKNLDKGKTLNDLANLRFRKVGEDFRDAYEKNYDTPGTSEYEAHEVLEPENWDEFATYVKKPLAYYRFLTGKKKGENKVFANGGPTCGPGQVNIDGKCVDIKSDEYREAYNKGIGSWQAFNYLDNKWEKSSADNPGAEWHGSVQTLPGVTITSKKVKPKERSVMSYVNPMNWGVDDYSNNSTFQKAYRKAKEAGEKEFMYGSNRYSTNYAGTPSQEMEQYGITSDQRVFNPSQIRMNLGNLNTGPGYGTELLNVLKVAAGEKNRDNTYSDEGGDGRVNRVQKEHDAFRLYLGLPQERNTFRPSSYKPGSYEIINYGQEFPQILNQSVEDDIKKSGRPEKESTFEKHKSGHTSSVKPWGDYVMGKHTVKRGKDDKGDYIEYIDNWDLDSYKLNPVGNLHIPVGDVADMTNKPFSIYGRVYYKKDKDGRLIRNDLDPTTVSNPLGPNELSKLMNNANKKKAYGGDISIPDLQEGNWLMKYGPGGQTTDGCPPNYYKNAQGKCVPEFKPDFRMPTNYSTDRQQVVVPMQENLEIQNKLAQQKAEAKRQFVGPAHFQTNDEKKINLQKKKNYVTTHSNTKLDDNNTIVTINPDRDMEGRALPNTRAARTDKGMSHMMNAIETTAALTGLGSVGTNLLRLGSGALETQIGRNLLSRNLKNFTNRVSPTINAIDDAAAYIQMDPIGIMGNRLNSQFYNPTVALNTANNTLTGVGRNLKNSAVEGTDLMLGENNLKNITLPKITPDQWKDMSGYLGRRQFIKGLQKEGLVGKEFNLGDVNYAARSTDRTNKLTQLALDRRHTGFRNVSGSLPYNGKGVQNYSGYSYDMNKPAYGQTISEADNMMNAGVDFTNPASIAEYQATHIPLEDYGYRSTGEWSVPEYGFLFRNPIATSSKEYGNFQFKSAPNLNFESGNYKDWFKKYYEDLNYHRRNPNVSGGSSRKDNLQDVMFWTKSKEPSISGATLVGPRGTKAFEIDKSFPFTNMENLSSEQSKSLQNYIQEYNKQYNTGWRGQYKKGGWLNKYAEGGQPEVTTETTKPPGMGAAGPILLPALIAKGIEKVSSWFGDDNKKPVVEKTAPLEETIHIDLKDPRKVRMTTGSKMNPNRDLMSGDYVLNEIGEAVKRAKKRGMSLDDAWNLAAIDFQETQLGNIDNQMGHAKDYKGYDWIDKFLNAYQDKMKTANRLKYKDPYLRLQVYNGLGKVYPETEQWYHGFKANSFYGVPVPKTGLDLKKNPLYGKQIVDLRDNVLKKNPEFVKFITEAYNSKKMGGQINWTNKYK
jgi:hypothetical protein